MKTKWMCMILMLALGLNLSACGSRQENGSSSENGTVKIEPQSEEDYLSENTGNEIDHMQIVTMDSLTFTGNNALVYAGMATDTSNGGDGVSVYGTVSTDSANLTIIKKADYKVAVEEVQKGGNLLIMPQSFDKNNGTLLMLDTASNTEKTMSFSSRSEGKDGVYCSGKGKLCGYFYCGGRQCYNQHL